MSSPKHSSKGQPLIPRLGTKAWEAEIRSKHIELGNITPPQPAKAAQARKDTIAAYLEAGNAESLANLAEAYAYDFEQTAAELERVKQQRDELAREVTRLNRGIVNDIAERERQTESNQAPSEYDLSILRQRDELLAALKLGTQLQGEGDIWSVNPGKMRAFLDAARVAIRNAEKEAK